MIRLAIAAALIALAPLSAQEAPAWPDTFTARLEALALMQTLNAEVLGSRSATQILENWCRDHRLAREPKILARMVTGVNKIPTAEQRQRLEVTGTPFGKVVESLQPYRQTFAVTLLWTPLPDGWERGSAALPEGTSHALAIPAALFEHRAILYTRDHRPFSEVSEVYQRQILAFPPRLR